MQKIIQLLNNKINIVDLVSRYTELIPSGNCLKGRCPIHGSQEGVPLVVYPHTNSYYCFACESGGGPVSFVADVEQIPYKAALEQLAKEANINLRDNASYQKEVNVEEENTRLAVRTHKNLPKIKEYLLKRGLTEDTMNTFMLGEENGSLTIPITNEYGQYVAIAKRQFEGKIKYINSYNNALYDKSKLLYGFDKAKKLIRNHQTLYLVEGYMDSLSGYQMGLATVAYCGNELQKEQITTLAHFVRPEVTIVYCPDNDEEGLKRVPRVRENFRKVHANAKVYVLQLPDTCKDFNDALLNGVDIQAIPLVHIDKFCVTRILNNCKHLEDEYNQMYDYLNTVSNMLIKSDIIKILADRWDRPFEELREFFKAKKEDIHELTKDADKTEGCLNDLKRLYERGEYQTRFVQLDNCIGGMTKKQVLLIGAYSGAGKTDVAIEYILRQISGNKLRCVFFSLEMPKGKVMERIIAKIVGCPLREVREIVTRNDESINQVIQKLDERFVVYDQNDLSIFDIEQRIMAVNQSGLLGGDVDVVIVDYFGYLKGTDDFEGASKQAKYMKYLAKKYNIIFCMLSQLSRKSNTYEEPTMDMLKMTGDLEASADVVVMMWRPDREPNISLEKLEKLKNITRMKVEKARDGVYGPTRMEFRYNIENSRLEEKNT